MTDKQPKYQLRQPIEAELSEDFIYGDSMGYVIKNPPYFMDKASFERLFVEVTEESE